MEDAIKKVESIRRLATQSLTCQTRAISCRTGMKQLLKIPSDITYYQPTTEFGTATLLENGRNYFTAATAPNTHKDYVFENNNNNE